MKHTLAFLALACQGAVVARLMRSNITEGPPGMLNHTVTKPTPTYKHRRDFFGNMVSSVVSSGISKLSDIRSSAQSKAASAILPAVGALPMGSAVKGLLKIDDKELAVLPTQVLQLPPYGNWTNAGWNVRFHGYVYKQPNVSQSTLNRLANVVLIGKSISDLTPSQADQARNVTASVLVVQQPNEIVSVHLEPARSAGSSGEPGGGGSVTASGGYQNLTLPYPTTPQGDYNVFLPISSNGLAAGNATKAIQKLNVYANGTATLGNATAYLVPPTGLTIISDVDDILRVTKIYEPAQGILNTIAYPYTPWMNMPDIYANWSASIPNFHFHYLTVTPEQATRNYMEFIYNTYPGGSFDTRPMNFSDVSATVAIRKFLLNQIFETFPQRKFILVGDSSNSDVMKAYPELVTDFPGQVQCILMRNVSATDPSYKWPYNTPGFKHLKQQMYMFFRTPEDLTGLDIVNGQCYNTSVPQNLTFGYQGLPFGLSTGGGISGIRQGLSDALSGAFPHFP